MDVATKRRKPKTPQERKPGEVQVADLFQTPPYAVELLLPFIPEHVSHIWEPACGQGNIVRVLEGAGYEVCGTDLEEGPEWNFLTFIPSRVLAALPGKDLPHAIVTNPPYSLKREFYQQCRLLGFRFAMLIPFEMNGWLWQATFEHGCRWVIPSRRIDYTTPTGRSGCDSNAQFHSAWLTWGFNLPEMMVGVELSLETKRGDRCLVDMWMCG